MSNTTAQDAQLGYTLLKQGQYEEAVRALQCILAREPDHPGALFNLGIAYMQLHRWVQAAETTQRYLKSVPHDYRACLRLGIIFRELKEREPSIIVLQHAVALKGKSAMAHRELGFSLLEAGRWDEACLAFRQSLRIKAQSVTGWCGLGKACELNGRPDLALHVYYEGLQKLETSNQCPIYVRLGRLYCQLHDWGQARAALEEAIAKGNNDPKIHLELGYVRYKAGDYDAALEQARILEMMGSDLGKRLRTIVLRGQNKAPARPESSLAQSAASAQQARSPRGSEPVSGKADIAAPPPVPERASRPAEGLPVANRAMAAVGDLIGPSKSPDAGSPPPLKLDHAASSNNERPQVAPDLPAASFQSMNPAAGLDSAVSGGVKLNFESAPTGTSPSGWDGDYDYASLKVQADSPPWGSRQYICFEKKEGAGRALFTHRFSDINGIVGIEFDLRCNDKNKFLLGFSVEKNGDIQRSIHTKILCSEARTTPTILLQRVSAPYRLGSWVHVKYVVDLIAGRLNGYLDNTHLVRDLTLQANPESLNMLAIHDNIGTTGVLLLANIRVYPYHKSPPRGEDA